MKYTKDMIEAIELEVEDVVLTSGSDTCSADYTCASEIDCPNDDTPSCRTELW